MKYADLSLGVSHASWTLLRCLASETLDCRGHVVDMATKLADTDICLTYTVYSANNSFNVMIKEEKQYGTPKPYFEIYGYIEPKQYTTILNDNKNRKKFPLSEIQLAVRYIKLLVDNFLKEVTVETVLEE